MATHERRLTRLETVLTGDAALPAWDALSQAQRRQAARVRLVVGTRLGLDASHPCLADAHALLVGDTPACRAADDALIARWHRAQGIPETPGAARARILERVALMARRTEDQA